MAQPIGSGGAALAVARQQRAREKFAILLLVEPGAFDIEQLEAGDELGECERVDGELRDRPVGSGVGLVVENMDGSVAHLEEIDVPGEAPRRAFGQEHNPVLALKLGDGIPREPNRHFDSERRCVVGEHEALERLVPQAVVADRRNDEPGHASREVLFLDHDQPRGFDLRERRLRCALAVAEQFVRTVDRYALEKIGDAREAYVFPALAQ